MVHDFVPARREITQGRPLFFVQPGGVHGKRAPSANRLEDLRDLAPLRGRLVVVEAQHESRPGRGLPGRCGGTYPNQGQREKQGRQYERFHHHFPFSFIVL